MVLPTPKFFLRINLGAEALTRWALVAAAMLIVLWIRTLPLTIPAADVLAEKILGLKVREQIALQVMEQVPGEGWKDYVEGAANEWLRRHRAEYDSAKAALRAEVEADFSFEAKNGRTYTYLGDYDSYVWLRNARNYLGRGTTCDAVQNGECRDAYGNAPVGYRMRYSRSLHIAAIVAVHRAITFFDPEYPLSASSFWVPVFLGVLGVLPAFFLGRRVGGDLGGVFAAVIISLYPPFLLRSVGSDNDVWNVVLPLFAAWAMAAALDGGKIVRAAIWAIAAGALTGMHALVWRGWLFTYGLLLSAALGHALLVAARAAAAHGLKRFWRGEGIRRVALVIFTYYVAAGVCTRLADESAFSVPFNMIASAVGLAAKNPAAGRAEILWPQALGTVSELSRPKPGDIAQYMGGEIFFFGAWLGLLALVLPKAGWRPRHFLLLAWTAALYVACYYAFAWSAVPRSALVFLFALPLAGELAATWLKKNAAARAGPENVSATLVLVWFFLALYMVTGGIRFLILFAVPFGLAFAAAAGRAGEWLEKRLQRAPPRYVTRAGARAASFAIVLAVVVYPVWRGYATVKNYYPAMNRAWWDTLVKIKNESAPDAIVNSWWDYGYWIKYAAERRASSDGGSLQTHVPYWLAKALVAPTEAESRGILRMLNCGSDATPLPEGAYGAFGRLRAMGLDDVRADAILLDVVKLDKAQAEQYLARRGFNAPEQTNLLSATHCRPPESFLVISKEMIFKGEWWMGVGSWDVKKAYLVHRARRGSEDEAVADWIARFGYRAEDARALYRKIAAFKSAAEVEGFIAPPQRLIPTEWIPCRRAGPEMSCRITLAHAGATRHTYFVYHPAAPKDGRLKSGGREGPPAVVLVAGATRLEETSDPAPAFADVGVLVDPAGERILIGTPLLIRSTLLRLLYLDPRYVSRFALFNRRSTAAGEEVATWKIDWKDE